MIFSAHLTCTLAPKRDEASDAKPPAQPAAAALPNAVRKLSKPVTPAGGGT